MTNIVQQPTKPTKRPGVSRTEDTADKLPLEGNDPVTVYVQQATDANGTRIAEFAASPNGPWYTGGITWTSNSEYALFVTLSMASPVSGIECELPYSPPSDTRPSLQQLCLLPVSQAKVSYQFFVTFSDGSAPHDPKIIITPIDPQTDKVPTGKA